MITDIFSSMGPLLILGVPLAASLIDMVDSFEEDGQTPNPADFARELEARGLTIQGSAVRVACRFDVRTLTGILKNAIHVLRENNHLPKRETLPPEILAQIFVADPDLAGVVRTPLAPQWSAYGIEGPAPGYALDPETRLGWFVSYLTFAMHDGVWTEAQKTSKISYAMLVRLRDRALPKGIRQDHRQDLREKLIVWSMQKEKEYKTLMAHLFDDFLAFRLGWLGLTREELWQKELVRGSRAYLFSKFGGLPPEDLRHRLQAMIRIASGRIDWGRAKNHPQFETARLQLRNVIARP